MSKLDTLKYLVNNNQRGIVVALYNYLVKSGITNNIDDEIFLKLSWYVYFGQKLNLINPQGFNEKLQWLKLYNRKPIFTRLVDKYEVKQYVATTVGVKYVIPTLGVWNIFDEIDFTILPKQFVLKCTHDSGSVCIVKDKNNMDLDLIRKKIESGLNNNLYFWGREWPYKYVKPRIIAEQYMEDETESHELTDYKLMCFNGKVRCSFTCTDRYSKEGLKVTFYDREWNKMPFERHYPSERVPMPRPKSYDEMVELAEKLAKDIPFVRVDFYEIKGRPYFGEMTFFPGNGMEEFTPEEWDYTLGSWIELPNKQS